MDPVSTMSDAGNHSQFSANSSTRKETATKFHFPGASAGDISQETLVSNADPRVPLLNLSTVQVRIGLVQQFLTDSINRNTLIGKDQMDMVSSEISSAVHQIIVNGAALLAYSQHQKFETHAEETTVQMDGNKVSDRNCSIHGTSSKKHIITEKSSEQAPLKFSLDDSCVTNPKTSSLKVEYVDEEMKDETEGADYDIVELDTVELLAEHIHFCEICGKGFKRDANLRMHMRAHGNQFKTPEALARPDKSSVSNLTTKTRFSCPFIGCNRHKSHKKFRPLKSAICVKNHFKRSHCPKLLSCNRCNKKSFSVVTDLRSHLKHCGEQKWRCSCGTTFSRKDKLFGHMTLFEGHTPAVMKENEISTVTMEDDEDEDRTVQETEMLGVNCMDNGFFEGLLEGFGSVDSYCLNDVLGSPFELDVVTEETYRF